MSEPHKVSSSSAPGPSSAGDAQLRRVTDITPVMLTLCDAEERYVCVNRAYAQHRNQGVDEIIGRTVREIVGEENYRIIRPHIERAMAGESVQYEAEIFYPASGLRTVTVSYEPERSETGEIRGWVSAISDVTELRKSQSELDDARARLESALEIAEVGTWTWDISTNQVHADKNLFRLFLGSESQTQSFDELLDLIEPEDRVRINQQLGESLQSESGLFECDFRIRRPNGQIRWSTARAQVQRDSVGKPARFSGLAIDITPRKRQEEKLETITQKLEKQTRIFNTALSSITDHVYTFDRAGRFIFINKPLLDLWGLTLDQAQGKNFFELHYPEALATRLHREIERVFLTQSTITGETEYTNPGGASGYFEYIFNPVFGSAGEVEVVAGSTRVITERKRQEAAVDDLVQRIDAQARLFDATLSNIADLAYTFDQNARVIYANKPLLAIWGLTLAEAVGKNYFDLQYPPELAERLNGQLLKVIQKGETIQGVTELTSASGVTDVHEYIYSPVLDPGGKVIAVAGTTRLITQRRKIETALRESEQKLSQIMSLMPAGVYSCDLEGQLTFFNRCAVELWGRTPKLLNEEHRFCGSYKIFLPDGTYLSPEATPMATALREGQSFRGVEVFVERPDGSRFLASVNIDPIYDEAGALAGAINVFQDITDRKEAESAERQLAAIVESSDDAIISKNLSGIVASWNRGAEYLFGYTAAEMIGQSISVLVPASRLNEEAEILSRIQKSERIENYETQRLRKDGTEVAVSLTVSAIRDDQGGVVGTSKIARNITKQKQFEAALREAKESAEGANRSKDRFLAVLSHELRTPLTPVIMAAAIRLMDPDLPVAAREDFEMIKRNIELETRLIDDLLDLSRITSGKLKLRREALELNALVKQVVEICHSQILEKGIRATLVYADNVGEILADSSRFQQILWNVLKNAAKFTPEGGSIYLKTFVVESGLVGVEVRDTGVGISPEALPNVFEAFEQGDPGISRQFGGMGLGLAISKALIELHGGSIRVSSAGRNQGSTFTVEVPGMVSARPPVTQSEPNPARARPLRLLIAEDHEDSALLLARLLQAFGHEVATAGTVARALELASQQPFDLLISDVGLPDATGYVLMKQIRQLYSMKGIAMSGYGMDEDLRKSEEAGFSEHLVKPVDVARLEQAILRIAKPI